MKHILRKWLALGLAVVLAVALAAPAAAEDLPLGNPATESLDAGAYQYTVPADWTLSQVLEDLIDSYQLAPGGFALSYACPGTGQHFDYGQTELMPAADTYILPLNLCLYAMRDEGALDGQTWPEGETLESLQEKSLRSHDAMASETLIGAIGSFRDYKMALQQRFGTEQVPAEAFYTENTCTTALMCNALQTLYDSRQTNYDLLETLEQAQSGMGLARYTADTPVAHCYGSYGDAAGDAAIVFAEEPFLLAVYTDGLPEPEELMGRICAALLAWHNQAYGAGQSEEPEPQTQDAAQTEKPEAAPEQAPAGSGALAWYIWAALGVGAVVLLLAALEIRAVILRRKRRAARLARKKAREAARAAQEEEG